MDGELVEAYVPNTPQVERVIKEIADYHRQAGIFAVDLSKTTIRSMDLISQLGRLWGKPQATDIGLVIVIDGDLVVDVARPSSFRLSDLAAVGGPTAASASKAGQQSGSSDQRAAGASSCRAKPPTMTQRSPADVLAGLGLAEEDLKAWEESGLGIDALDDWVTDRVARRPTGRRAREVYGADDVHDFAPRAILEALDPGPGDRLLEIGCGGGLLLRDALARGTVATGVDHSEEMVRLARERAPGANVLLASADHLPLPDGQFTAVAMSVVFFFLNDPVAVLRECRRVLAPGGRIAIYTTAPELRGTPAAPEPIASRGHFYTDQQLAALAVWAGLANAHVVNDRGGQLLTARVV